ncbi:MAG: metal-dependent transcriptional regulator [Anaerolineaceae bacterium]|jgi:DtxR family Mn-dependent transcriptional regulator|nr:metal-dependent transcriptional regulator [Anaerolineaceae bacterium]
MLSESTEMYLKAVYRLTQHESYAATSKLAAELGVSPASVSEKIKSLAEQGYLIHEWREGVVLTPAGRKVALNILRKHRLVSTFLVEKVGYEIDEVYQEACNLEHAVSDHLVNRLEEMLGFPKVDPLGNPIPNRDGRVEPRHYRMLSEMPVGKALVVQALETVDQKRLTYLRSLGLVPGSEVVIQDVAPFEGPLTVLVGKKKVAIAPALAGIVGVSNGSEEHKQ